LAAEKAGKRMGASEDEEEPAEAMEVEQAEEDEESSEEGDFEVRAKLPRRRRR
jgi:hypothetical protein